MLSVDESTLKSMQGVREQQERLARLHFDLYTESTDDEVWPSLEQDEDELDATDAKFDQLRDGLRDLQSSM